MINIKKEDTVRSATEIFKSEASPTPSGLPQESGLHSSHQRSSQIDQRSRSPVLCRSSPSEHHALKKGGGEMIEVSESGCTKHQTPKSRSRKMKLN